MHKNLLFLVEKVEYIAEDILATLLTIISIYNFVDLTLIFIFQKINF